MGKGREAEEEKGRKGKGRRREGKKRRSAYFVYEQAPWSTLGKSRYYHFVGVVVACK